MVVPVGSSWLHRPDGLHLADRIAALELLPVDVAVAADLGDEALGERVDDGDADAVQAAGDLVAVAAELAAGVKLREDDRERGQALLRHHVDGDARAPVDDRDRMVGMEGHLDAVVTALECLVDGVVDELVDEVMEAAEAGRADVHPRPEPDRLEAFEDGDVLCGVVCFGHEKSPANEAFAGKKQCIRSGGRPGRRTSASCMTFATDSRSSRSAIEAVISSASRTCSGVGPGGARGGLGRRIVGQRSGDESQAADGREDALRSRAPAGSARSPRSRRGRGR